MELAHLDYRQEWRLNWLSALLDDQNWYYKGRSEETRENEKREEEWNLVRL